MTSPDVLKEIGIKRHTFATNLHEPWHDTTSAKYAEFYSVEDITNAIRRGDLIPRSNVKEVLLAVGYWKDVLPVGFVDVIRRLLKETKP